MKSGGLVRCSDWWARLVSKKHKYHLFLPTDHFNQRAPSNAQLPRRRRTRPSPPTPSLPCSRSPPPVTPPHPTPPSLQPGMAAASKIGQVIPHRPMAAPPLVG
jgi:hypothetical protein